MALRQDEDELVKNEAIKSIKRLRHQGHVVARLIFHFFNLT